MRKNQAGLNDELIARAQANNIAAMQQLLEYGASPSILFENSSLLDYAVQHNSVEMVNLLFRYKAIPRSGTVEVTPEIVKAAHEKKWAVVQAFINNCKSSERYAGYENLQYGRALLEAVKDRQYEMVIQLIEAGASLDWTAGEDKEGLLHLAVRNNDAKMVSLLLAYDRNPSALNSKGKSAIELANESNAIQCQLAFAENGTFFRLYNAVRKGDYDAVKKLLDAHGIQHLVDWNGNSLLHIAVQYHINDHRGMDYLYCRSNFSRHQIIKLLLDHQMDTTMLNNAGKTALDTIIDLAISHPTNNYYKITVFALKEIYNDYYFHLRPALLSPLLKAIKSNQDSAPPSLGSIIYNELVKKNNHGELPRDIEELIHYRDERKQDLIREVLKHIQTLPPEEKLKAITMAFNEKTQTSWFFETRRPQSSLNAFFTAKTREDNSSTLSQGPFKELSDNIGSIIYNELIKNSGNGQLSNGIQQLIRNRNDVKEQVIAHIQTLTPKERLRAIDMACKEETEITSFFFKTRRSQSDLNAFFAQQRGFRETAFNRGSFKKLNELRAKLPESMGTEISSPLY